MNRPQSFQIVIAFVMLMTSPLKAQTHLKFWTGNAGNSSFVDGNNWDPVGVPTYQDTAYILNDHVVLDGNARIKFMNLFPNASLHIMAGAELKIDSSNSEGLICNTDNELRIDGSLIIQDCIGQGLRVKGRVIIGVTGKLEIENVSTGIDVFSTDTLFNYGSIQIDSVVTTRGLAMSGVLYNYENADIEIKTATYAGAYIGTTYNYGNISVIDAKFTTYRSGIFHNHSGATYSSAGGSNSGLNVHELYNHNGGTVVLSDNGSNSDGFGMKISLGDSLYNDGTLTVINSADDGIFNEGYISNQSSGIISIQNSGRTNPGRGLYNRPPGVVLNEGTINIDGSQLTAFQNDGSVENQDGGNISIQNSQLNGIQNTSSFINSENIFIDISVSDGISNFGLFQNQLDASITITNSGSDGVFVQFNHQFINEGSLSIDQSDSRGIGNGGLFTNEDSGILTINNSGSYGIFNGQSFSSFPNVFTNNGLINIQNSVLEGVFNSKGLILLTPVSLTNVLD